MNIYDILEDLNEIREEADNRRKNTVYLTSLFLLFVINLPFWLYIFALLGWIFAFYQLSDLNSFFYRIFFRDEKIVLKKISSYELSTEQENALMRFYFPYLDGNYKTLEEEFDVTINTFEAVRGYGSDLYIFSRTFLEYFGKDKISEKEAELLARICISLMFKDKIKIIKKYKVPLKLEIFLKEIFEKPVAPVPKNLKDRDYKKLIEWEEKNVQ
jgi:hypothetical protein